MPPLPALLPIIPFTRPARGAVVLPGSKSITNRALLLAALCERPVTLTGALFSEDTALMATALQRLGYRIETEASAGRMRVSGQDTAFQAPAPVDLFVGLAGTTARFLTALCAAAPRGHYRLDGVPQMRKRPVKGLLDALRALGADIRCTGEEGFFPLEIHARGLNGGPVEVDARESSQLLSALLMVAPRARSAVSIAVVEDSVRWPFVEMSLNLMRRFGHTAIRATPAPLRIEVPPQPAYSLRGDAYRIDSDATAASYFIALPILAGGELTLADYDTVAPLQGDVQFARLLQDNGLIAGLDASGTTHTIRRGPACRGVTADFNAFSDTFLTLAAISPLLEGPTHLTGLAHTRKQETDRVAGMARELRKLGQDVAEEHDALRLTPRPLSSGIEIETYGDHRFAMSFGMLGCHDLHGDGRPWLAIRNPACCAKTFPGFFELLESLRKKSLSS